MVVSPSGDDPNNDVRDRAQLYYRLLLASPDQVCDDVVVMSLYQAKSIICSVATSPGSEFLEHSRASKEHLFDEFNSLSVVYGLPVG